MRKSTLRELLKEEAIEMILENEMKNEILARLVGLQEEFGYDPEEGPDMSQLVLTPGQKAALTKKMNAAPKGKSTEEARAEMAFLDRARIKASGGGGISRSALSGSANSDPIKFGDNTSHLAGLPVGGEAIGEKAVKKLVRDAKIRKYTKPIKAFASRHKKVLKRAGAGGAAGGALGLAGLAGASLANLKSNKEKAALMAQLEAEKNKKMSKMDLLKKLFS